MRTVLPRISAREETKGDKRKEARFCDFFNGQRKIPTTTIRLKTPASSERLRILRSRCFHYLTDSINHQLRLIPLNIMAALFRDDVIAFRRQSRERLLHL